MELIWLVEENTKENIDYETKEIKYIWDVTTIADTRIIENNQTGLLSQAYSPGVLSRNESGITYLYNWYINSMNVSR